MISPDIYMHLPRYKLMRHTISILFVMGIIMMTSLIQFSDATPYIDIKSDEFSSDNIYTDSLIISSDLLAEKLVIFPQTNWRNKYFPLYFDYSSAHDDLIPLLKSELGLNISSLTFYSSFVVIKNPWKEIHQGIDYQNGIPKPTPPNELIPLEIIGDTGTGSLNITISFYVKIEYFNEFNQLYLIEKEIAISRFSTIKWDIPDTGNILDVKVGVYSKYNTESMYKIHATPDSLDWGSFHISSTAYANQLDNDDPMDNSTKMKDYDWESIVALMELSYYWQSFKKPQECNGTQSSTAIFIFTYQNVKNIQIYEDYNICSYFDSEYILSLLQLLENLVGIAYQDSSKSGNYLAEYLLLGFLIIISIIAFLRRNIRSYGQINEDRENFYVVERQADLLDISLIPLSRRNLESQASSIKYYLEKKPKKPKHQDLEKVERYNAQALRLMNRMRPADALRAYDKALRYDQNNITVLLNKANLLQRVRYYPAAYEILEKIILLEPSNKKARERREQLREKAMERQISLLSESLVRHILLRYRKISFDDLGKQLLCNEEEIREFCTTSQILADMDDTHIWIGESLKEEFTRGKQCQICFSDKYNKENVEIICVKCEYHFHQIEFQEWVLRKGSCPLCREKVDSKMYKILQ